MRFTPWLALKDNRFLVYDTYALDYTQMLLPVALVQSFKRRHFQVFLITLTSALLKVHIVLAPSIFNTARVLSQESVQVQVTDLFPQADSLANETHLSYYNARASQDFELALPFGLTNDFAYQTFSPIQNQDARAEASIEQPITATVDALSLDVECVTSDTWNATMKLQESIPVYDFYITLHFESCDEPIDVQVRDVYPSHPQRPRLSGNRTVYWALGEFVDNERPCPSLPQKYPQFVYYAAYFRRLTTNDTLMDLESCSAVVCAPRASISKVQVAHDGVRSNVTTLSEHEDAPADTEINPWTLFTEVIPIGQGSWLDRSSIDDAHLFETRAPIWGPALADVRFRDQNITGAADVYQSNMIYDSIKNLTKALGPQIAHIRLRQDETNVAGGSRLVHVERLQVSQAVSAAMIALFVVSALISLWAIRYAGHFSKSWVRDPSTILGVMASFCRDGESDELDVPIFCQNKATWSLGTYTPLALRTWFRSACTVYTVLLIVGYAVTLGLSQRDNGLLVIDEEVNPFVIWKSIPTLSLLAVAIYCSSLDAAVRGLASYNKLSIQPCAASELDTSFADILGLRAMWRAFKFDIPAIVLTQTIVVLSSFLTSISSILFNPVLVPQSHSLSLPQESWFGTPASIGNRAPFRGLFPIRNTPNISFPDGTYYDLVFPTISTHLHSEINGDTLRLTIPAARMGQDCEKLTPGADFNTTVENGLEVDDMVITINLLFTLKNGSLAVHPFNRRIRGSATRNGTGYIATHLEPYLEDFKRLTNSSEIFAWGKLSAKSESLSSMSIWRCKYFWTAVETDVSLLKSAGRFQINPNTFPMPDDSTVRPWEPSFSIADIFHQDNLGTRDINPFPEVRSPDPQLGEFERPFQSLLEPLGSIKLDDLGEVSKDTYVLEELNSALRFSWAQVANVENRLSLDEESASPPLKHPELSLIDATVINNQRYRLVQNPIATSFILAILSLIVIVNTWALVSQWLRGRVNSNPDGRRWLRDLSSRNLAPENFNSAEMMESLLHGSNYHKSTPDSAVEMPSNQLHEAIGRQFRMGWFFDGRKQEAVYTIGALGDEEFEFTGPNKGSTRSYDRLEPTTEEGDEAQSLGQEMGPINRSDTGDSGRQQ